jgi:hypothetical protein
VRHVPRIVGIMPPFGAGRHPITGLRRHHL